MGKSKNKNGSEVSYLKGKIRQLEAEVKFLKRHQHITTEDLTEQEEVLEVEVDKCPKCSGILVSYDYNFIILSKCGKCSFEKRQKKKSN